MSQQSPDLGTRGAGRFCLWVSQGQAFEPGRDEHREGRPGGSSDSPRFLTALPPAAVWRKESHGPQDMSTHLQGLGCQEGESHDWTAVVGPFLCRCCRLGMVRGARPLPTPVSRSLSDCVLLTVGDMGLLSTEGLCFMGSDCLSLPVKQVLFSLKSQSSFPEHGAQMSDFMPSFLSFWGEKSAFCTAWTLWSRRAGSPQVSP